MTHSFENLVDLLLPEIGGKKYSILFVDDQQSILRPLKHLFQQDYKVFTATSGLEALEIIKREKINLICSDQMMPGMLGHELLAKVKEISPATTRVLMTAYNDLQAIMHCVNSAGIYRYVHKPWDHSEFEQNIRRSVAWSIINEKMLKALG